MQERKRLWSWLNDIDNKKYNDLIQSKPDIYDAESICVPYSRMSNMFNITFKSNILVTFQDKYIRNLKN